MGSSGPGGAEKSCRNKHLKGPRVFPKIVVPQNGWFIVENHIKTDDFGVPPFSETPMNHILHLIFFFGYGNSNDNVEAQMPQRGPTNHVRDSLTGENGLRVEDESTVACCSWPDVSFHCFFGGENRTYNAKMHRPIFDFTVTHMNLIVMPFVHSHLFCAKKVEHHTVDGSEIPNNQLGWCWNPVNNG